MGKIFWVKYFDECLTNKSFISIITIVWGRIGFDRNNRTKVASRIIHEKNKLKYSWRQL